MTYGELVASVDRIAFRTACATLMDEEVAQELCVRALRLPLPAQTRLALLLRLFEDLPMYSVLVHTTSLLHLLGAPQRDLFFAALVAALARERSAAADAVETALFADLLADPVLVEELWPQLVEPGVPAPVLRSALRVSAPVPWRLKRGPFARLAAEPEWHDQLLTALRGARHALLGSTLDAEEARLLLDRLVLPERAEELERFRRRIAPDP